MKFLFVLLSFAIWADQVSPQWEGFDCHSPTGIELKDHSLLVAWFGGAGENQCDFPEFTGKVGIWISHQEGKEWSHPECIASHEGTRCWNPVLHRLKGGELILFYKVGDNPREWKGVFKRSFDEGKRWSEEEALPPGILGPIRTKVVEGPKGELICGSSVEVGDLENPFQATACWIEVATPDLKEWKRFGPIEIPGQPFGALQPTLFYDQQNRLHLLCRDRAWRVGRKGFIWHASSEDQGQHWSPLERTDLPNPDSGIDTLKISDGHILLAYNPSHQSREPLALALSSDGVHWSPLCLVDVERSEYPYLFSTQDGSIHLLYAHTKALTKQREILVNSFKPRAAESDLLLE